MINIFPSASYEVWLDTPGGQRVKLLDQFSRLDYTRKLNTIGRFLIEVPADTVPDSLVRRDAIIEIWRTLPGQPSALLGGGFLKGWEYADNEGMDILTLMGVDGLWLLQSRRVAYASGTAYATKSDYADDMIKAVLRENLGASATDTDRDLSGYGFSVASDVSLGATVDRDLAWKTVLSAAKDIADASRAKGTPLYYNVMPVVLSPTQIGWQFYTNVNQLHADRASSDNLPTVFGREWGNLEGARLVVNHENEITYTYVAGQGDAGDRATAEVSDAARLSQSIWGRIEDYIQNNNTFESASLTDTGYAALNAGRPTRTLTGNLKDTPQTRYGVHWNFGDRVVVMHRGLTYSALVDSVALAVGADGSEQIAAQIEVTE